MYIKIYPLLLLILSVLVPVFIAQLITKTVECMYFHISPILTTEIKHYYAPKHYYVMRDKLRRLSISKGLPEITIRKCIWEKFKIII